MTLPLSKKVKATAFNARAFGKNTKVREECKKQGIVPIETKTKWGKISAILMKEGERYYMLLDKKGVVSLLPADVVENGYLEEE